MLLSQGQTKEDVQYIKRHAKLSETKEIITKIGQQDKEKKRIKMVPRAAQWLSH